MCDGVFMASASERWHRPLIGNDALQERRGHSARHDCAPDHQSRRSDKAEHIGKRTGLIQFRLHFWRAHETCELLYVETDCGCDGEDGTFVGDKGGPHEAPAQELLQSLTSSRDRGPSRKF